MRNNKEVFYLKVDTDFGMNGFVLLNRQEYHYGGSNTVLLHDLFEHPYKPIRNPYLDEIAALGAYNEYRVCESNRDMTRELYYIFTDCYDQCSHNFRNNIKYLDSKSEEVFETVEIIKNEKDKDIADFVDHYKYLFSYYFNLGASIFDERFNKYFHHYSDLYYVIGDEILYKLNPLLSTDLEKIKLTVDYKSREVKVEY